MGERLPPVRTQNPEDIIAAMQRWSEEFIEQPHWVVGDLPVCPFAKAARLKKTVRFDVLAFDLTDPLDPTGAILTLVRDLPRRQELETLFVIHPHPAQIGAGALEAFVGRLNTRMAAETLTSDLQAFEAHPNSEFCIGGVYTRRSPYPSFQVLSRTRLKTASDSLLGSRYYDHFTPAMLRAVGMPRDERVPERSSRWAGIR
jgi:hypothetical protein